MSDDTQVRPGTQNALLHRLAKAQVDGRAPSLAGGVVRDGTLVWSAGCGSVDGHPPTSDTQYRIGSLTKTFIAVLVMRLRDEGLVDLAAPLATYLPGTSADGLRIAELLAHTSGLASESPEPWWERTPGDVRPQLPDVLGDPPSKHPAGRRFHYSNTGFALLGALVAQVRGEPWVDALRREVLEPLDMPRTTAMPEPPHALGWAVHPWADVLLPEPTHDAGLMAPAGQLWSTIDDLTRFATFLANGDERVLSADTVKEMRRTAAPPEGETWDASYGLGMQLARFGGRSLAGHTGSMPGFLATLWVSADDGLAGITLANATSGPDLASVTADLIALVADREPRVRRPWRPLTEVDPELLGLTGLWYWGAAPFARATEGRTGTSSSAGCAARDGRRASAPRRTAPGPASTVTTPARPCAWCGRRTARSATWTSAASSSPGSPTTRPRRFPAASTRPAGGRCPDHRMRLAPRPGAATSGASRRAAGRRPRGTARRPRAAVCRRPPARSRGWPRPRRTARTGQPPPGRPTGR